MLRERREVVPLPLERRVNRRRAPRAVRRGRVDARRGARGGGASVGRVGAALRERGVRRGAQRRLLLQLLANGRPRMAGR
jgi:hypothetical protein